MPPHLARRDPAIAVRGAGLQAVTALLGAARGLEQLALRDHAHRVRRLAELVAAEYCHLALDDAAPTAQALPDRPAMALRPRVLQALEQDP